MREGRDRERIKTRARGKEGREGRGEREHRGRNRIGTKGRW